MRSEAAALQRISESRLFAIALALIVLVVDLASKWLVHQNLPLMNGHAYVYPYGGIGIFQNFLGIEFSISHATNRGAAWGILSNYQTALLAFRMVLVSGIMAYFWLSERHPSWRIPLALVLAGAVGNILDAFFYGHVVDMLHFVFWGYDYPTFNVADSAIFVGIAFLILSSWFE